MAEQCTVSGRIFESVDHPLGGVTVQAYDKDLRSEQLLGEATSTAEGVYEIKYTSDQFRRADKGTADLMFRANGAGGFSRQVTELRTNGTVFRDPPIVFNAPAEARVDLIVEL